MRLSACNKVCRAPIKIEVFDSEKTSARAAAKFIAAEATAAVFARGRFVLAVSDHQPGAPPSLVGYG